MKLMILGSLSVLLLSTALTSGAKAEQLTTPLYAPRAQFPALSTSSRSPTNLSNLYAPRAQNPSTLIVRVDSSKQTESTTSQISSPSQYSYLLERSGAETTLLIKSTKAEKTQLQATGSQESAQVTRQPAFSAVPRLIGASASQKGAYVPSTYKFTLIVPEDAGEALKVVRISQTRVIEDVKFNAGRSKAFVGEQVASGSEIPLASVGGTEQSGEVTIVFDQPVQPGSTVTVALETEANPSLGGIYLFGITAFPRNENGMGQFLGYGRITLYGNSN